MSSEDFDSLIRQAQGGDRKAMENLLEEIRPYLEKVARGYADPSRASRSTSDLVQEAELRAWEKLDQFQGGEEAEETIAKFRSWMIQIVHRLALDIQRSRNTQRRKAPGYVVLPLDKRRPGAEGETSSKGPRKLDPPAKQSTASAKFQSSERALLVRAAINSLPDERDRQIVQLFFFEGVPLTEVSTRLNLPYHKVKEHYRASMARLGQQLGGLWKE